MKYIGINKTKKLGNSNYGWGIWNLKTNIKKGEAYFLRDCDFHALKTVPYPYGRLIDSINEFLTNNPDFKKVLIKDVFEHYFLWIY